MDEELEKLRPKDPFDEDEPEDQEEEVHPNQESSEEESIDTPFISPKRFARAREASRKESPTAQKNRFTPLDSSGDRTTIAGRGPRLPSPITPQTDQTQISANSSAGSFVEDIKKQHDEFRMMMDRLMAAAKPPASEPPGLPSRIPPMPKSFEMVDEPEEEEGREIVELPGITVGESEAEPQVGIQASENVAQHGPRKIEEESREKERHIQPDRHLTPRTRLGRKVGAHGRWLGEP